MIAHLRLNKYCIINNNMRRYTDTRDAFGRVMELLVQDNLQVIVVK